MSRPRFLAVGDESHLTLVVSSQPPIDVGSHFDALLRYPYGCTEQSTSSGYPWVLVTPEAADRLGLRASIESRFERGYSDGGRGWWGKFGQLVRAMAYRMPDRGPAHTR